MPDQAKAPAPLLKRGPAASASPAIELRVALLGWAPRSLGMAPVLLIFNQAIAAELAMSALKIWVAAAKGPRSATSLVEMASRALTWAALREMGSAVPAVMLPRMLEAAIPAREMVRSAERSPPPLRPLPARI